MKRHLQRLAGFALLAALLAGCAAPLPASRETSVGAYDYELVFPSDKYPETALHIMGAIEQGHSAVCTIDRNGAEDNRRASLAGIDTRDGYDRDEWPMAMCKEGGAGASVAYIDASDNRGAGSWVGNMLSEFDDNDRILFIVTKPKKLFPEPETAGTPANAAGNADSPASATRSPDSPAGAAGSADSPASAAPDAPVYASCAEARAAGAAPLRENDPGYSLKLDRDRDGVACE